MIFLGVDCGTQSLKVLLWDSEEEHTTSVSVAYDLIEGLPPGHKEQHPEIWITALEDCMQQLKDTGAPLEAVRGIGVSGQQHGLVVLDAADEVIRPAKLWNDTSTEDQCRRIVEAAGGIEKYRAEIGNSLPPGFTASKVLWIKEQEPESYSRIRTFFLPHDFLNFYLTGEKVAEAGDASGSGYFDVTNRSWSSMALTWIDPDKDLHGCLPRLIESSDIVGAIRTSLAQRWGLPTDAIVSAGGGDNMMGAIGSGNVKPGLTTVSLGTSGTIYSHSPQPIIDPQGEIAAFCDSTGGWLPLGCTMSVTVATEMIRHNFLSVDHKGFEVAVSEVPAGSDGLILLPYLEGERMPPVPMGTGTLLGLRPKTSNPSYLARASMEGVTMGLRYGLERLQKLGVDSRQIRLIGGGAKSTVWRQVAADIFDVELACPTNEEGPAFGAALQAMWAAVGGEIADLADEFVGVDEKTRQIPSPENAERYSRLYEIYDELSASLGESEVFPKHRQFIHDID